MSKQTRQRGAVIGEARARYGRICCQTGRNFHFRDLYSNYRVDERYGLGCEVRLDFRLGAVEVGGIVDMGDDVRTGWVTTVPYGVGDFWDALGAAIDGCAEQLWLGDWVQCPDCGNHYHAGHGPWCDCGSSGVPGDDDDEYGDDKADDDDGLEELAGALAAEARAAERGPVACARCGKVVTGPGYVQAHASGAATLCAKCYVGGAR